MEKRFFKEFYQNKHNKRIGLRVFERSNENEKYFLLNFLKKDFEGIDEEYDPDLYCFFPYLNF